MIWGALLVIVVLVVTLWLDKITGGASVTRSIDSDSGVDYDRFVYDSDDSADDD